MQVTVRNDNVNRALSIFKRKCSEVVMEVRDRQHYVKPTVKRNKAKRLAVVREQKRQRNDNKPA